MPEQALQQPEASEAELIARARDRDAGAIRAIIKTHNQRLYRLARSIIRDDTEAEDVLQDAYVRAFKHLDSFRGEARLGTWLGRIVVNEALMRLRRRRPTVALEAAVEPQAQVIPFPLANPQLDPETTMAQRQIRVLLEEAIDKLPEGFRTVLVARVIEGMSVEETAELLGIPPDTVKTRLFRARRLLKHDLEQQVGPLLGGAFPFAGRRCEDVAAKVLARLGMG